MITALLILHGLLAVALIGSVSHQAIAVTLKRVEFRARPHFVRFRATDPNLYTATVAILFLIVRMGCRSSTPDTDWWFGRSFKLWICARRTAPSS